MGETKSMYLSWHGLAPYFSKLLQSPYVLLYDESLNRDLQKKQMDMHIRFRCDGKFCTRYFSSAFLGHSCAGDILRSLESAFDKDILLFKMACKNFYVQLVIKILSKSPLEHALVRKSKCLDPSLIIQEPMDMNARRFKVVLDELQSKQKVDIEICDKVHEEYRHFITHIRQDPSFFSFNKSHDSLDVLYHKLLSSNNQYANLWTKVKLLLLLSHGQATVERCFSVNKDVSTTNLQDTTLIAKRIFKDHINSVGGLKKLSVSWDLLRSAQQGRQRYRQHLEGKRKTEKSAKRGKKGRRSVMRWKA